MKRPVLIMGVLNVTPDSFSDGGLYFNEHQAIAHAQTLIEQGADIIDIGGESTRPGAETVQIEEEIRRVIPVIEALKSIGVRLSIDTSKYEVAKEALSRGVSIINDVAGAADPRMAKLAADHSADYIVMHMKGTPRTMQIDPEYKKGVVSEVKSFFEMRIKNLKESGLKAEQIWLDPGIGFGKTLAHNLALLKDLSAFKDLAGRVVIGTSRKSFLGKISQSAAQPSGRLAGTIASTLWALEQGASVVRVHDVAETAQAITTWRAIRES